MSDREYLSGPLGGTASFQRMTTEMRSYSTLATFGKSLGPEPLALVLAFLERSLAARGAPPGRTATT